MNNVYRICLSYDDNGMQNEFTVIAIGSDIKRIISSLLDKYDNSDILEISRLNYAGEKVFDII